MDWVTGLVPGGKENFKDFLVIVNRYSKGLRCLPLIGTQNSNQNFGPTSMTFLEIRLAFSTAYHPNKDGLAERMIQKMEDIIRRFFAYGMEYYDHKGYTHDRVTLLPQSNFLTTPASTLPQLNHPHW
ncbi:hypothetical protein O181_015481 [Austropuccinia psidii MF-1]|uniref:Integrase catalytic domain-containing protein n=1 Tax=Austropuccinia psidii MF-1 TaxID=1389203 RepID=A0A9Q3GQ56_9BASI|nr:hypothetical protein [Austropuccinia psidii MF-1]